uniref:Iodothyronine deiodinase n=2 Tax=Astyanax mexicanus TaxID=7994 RepID=W5KCU8_ASTMX
MWTAVGFTLRRLKVYLSSIYMLHLLLFQFCVLNLLVVLAPGLARRIMLRLGVKSTMALNPLFRFEDWAPSFTTARFLLAVLRGCWSCFGDSAFVGFRAPDTPLITMKGDKTSVHQFIRGNRPLILSFGSCT